MTDAKTDFDPERDLSITRIIRAPRQAVWEAWTVPANLEQWWIPAPTLCRVVDLDLRPGGAFRTQMNDGEGFVTHLDACFLDIDPGKRIVFTTALLEGWRPAPQSFVTAVLTFADHAEGTDYTARALHAGRAERDRHAELGFHDGWGTVADQLAALVEGRMAAQ